MTNGCKDDMDIKQGYEFEVTHLPVQKKIGKGQTAEIRCRINTSGNWQDAQYYIRYFQPDGKGELKIDNGTVLLPNDLYLLNSKEFRLYYTSHSEDQQVIDIYFVDNFDQMFSLSISFTGE